MNASDSERTYMIAGEDEDGDQHMVVTSSIDRLKIHYERMLKDFGTVRGNDAFQSVRALFDGSDAGRSS